MPGQSSGTSQAGDSERPISAAKSSVSKNLGKKHDSNGNSDNPKRKIRNQKIVEEVTPIPLVK
jgi:hypothetical protein